MENFSFQAHTKIIFGKGTEAQAGAESARFGKKVLLHYGGGSIKKTGLYDRVMKSLKAAGLTVFELPGAQPNPRLSLVRKGIEICRKEGVELVLAVGGGSVIDSAKAIAFGTLADRDVWEFYTDNIPVTEALPMATILTLPAAGSEGSPDTVVSNEETERKLAAHGDVIRPVFSILNPELTLTLPSFQTAAGISDMFAHIMERYFTATEEVDFIDNLAEGAMRGIQDNSRKLMADPDNYDYRAEIMLAGLLAHNGILGLGRSEDWMSHNIEHELSALWDMTHGEGLAIIFPAWMKYVYKNDIPRFARFAKNVFGIEEADEEKSILKMIETLKEWYRFLGLKTSLSDFDFFDESKIPLMAERCLPDGAVGGAKTKLKAKDVEAIFRLAV